MSVAPEVRAVTVGRAAMVTTPPEAAIAAKPTATEPVPVVASISEVLDAATSSAVVPVITSAASPVISAVMLLSLVTMLAAPPPEKVMPKPVLPAAASALAALSTAVSSLAVTATVAPATELSSIDAVTAFDIATWAVETARDTAPPASDRLAATEAAFTSLSTVALSVAATVTAPAASTSAPPSMVAETS